MRSLLPVIVVVMVAAGDAADPTSVAMIQTTKRALAEPDATILTIETQSTPTDGAAESIAGAQHADAIVIVSWSSNHEHARVRVRSASGAWAERDVDFSAADAPEERGRALGLVAATMVPGSPAVSKPAPKPIPAPAPVPAPTVPVRRAVAALGIVVAGGIDEPGVSAGPGIVGSVRIAWWIWAHVAADVRFGTWNPAKASAVWLAVAPGIGIRVPLAHDVSVGFRTQVGVLATHLSAASANAGRATMGMTTLGELAWQPGRLGLVLGFGIEVPFEKTAVFLGAAAVGALPTLRLRSELAATVAF